MLGSFFLVVVFFLLTVFVTVGLALHILFEHRILGCIHIFKGPKRVGFVGIFQHLEMLLHCFLAANQGNIKGVFNAMRGLTKNAQPTIVPIRDKEGKPVTSIEGQIHRWK